MSWFHVHFIACNALQFLCNNCRLSSVTESVQLKDKDCSALHAINCTWNHVYNNCTIIAQESRAIVHETTPEARAIKFSTKVEVLPKRWQITPKRGVVSLTWPIFVCTTVELEKISTAIGDLRSTVFSSTDYWLSHLRRSTLVVPYTKA